MYDIRSFRRLLTKEQVCSVPNYMSFFRFVMIPFIIWFYATERFTVAVILLAVCELTDVLDGLIARKYKMTTELGKVLDPVCDKFMQGALGVCLLLRHSELWFVWAFFGFLVVKELSMLVLGGLAARRTGKMQSARWYGKVSTVALNTSMIVLFLLPDLEPKYILILLCVAAAAMLLSLVLYTRLWISLIRYGEEGAGPEPSAEKTDQDQN
ncbi:MAG: CDP-alcohol phosphatidyltransferase family protein [Oscillospiraceae bacterium]|nr:CDP-alcohol phosphatidyltransferase family protein [Oscillospiraceae bacterium]